MGRDALIILGLLVIFVLSYLILNLLAGQWDRVTLGVKVYGAYSETVEGARVNLYNDSLGNGEFPQGSLVATAYTDDSGVANFNGIPISGLMYIRVSKEGYRNSLRNITELDKISGLVEVFLKEELKPLRVTVEEGSSYGGYRAVAGARVDLYNASATGYSYGSGYVLIKTMYTNDYGVADFGKADIENGEVRVGKYGYENETQYVSSYYSNREITVYLTPIAVGHAKEPLTVVVLSYYSGQEGILNAVAGARLMSTIRLQNPCMETIILLFLRNTRIQTAWQTSGMQLWKMVRLR